MAAPYQVNSSQAMEIENPLTFQEKVLLQDRWNAGTLRHGQDPEVISVAEKHGISTKKIKQWINNQQRKQRKTVYKAAEKRKTTGFNLFCRENTCQGQPVVMQSKTWAEKWKALTDVERSSFKLRASQEPKKINKKRREYQLVKKLNNTCKQLEELGILTGGVSLNKSNQELTIFGSDTTRTIMKRNTAHFSLMFSQSVSTISKHHHQSSSNKEELRSEVQAIFRNRYNAEFGGKISYMADAMEKIKVDGLPVGVEFKRPSSYGKNTLKAIIANCEKIKFCRAIPTENEKDKDLPAIQTSNQDQDKDLPAIQTSNQDQDEPIQSSLVQDAEKLMIDILEGNVILEETEENSQYAIKKSITNEEVQQSKSQDLKREFPENQDNESSDLKTPKKKKKNGKNGKQEEKTFIVEDIKDKKNNLYKVKWKGYKKTTWEPKENIPDEILHVFGF